MSKVLVDRELLECLADLGDGAIERMGSYLAKKHGKYVDAARAILAQPAEAEGVDVVAEVSLLNKQPVGVPMLREGGGWTLQAGEKLVRQSDHLAALSAVTAERDHLRAEVEALRTVVAQSVEYLDVSSMESICSGSILHQRLRAAMAAKDA